MRGGVGGALVVARWWGREEANTMEEATLAMAPRRCRWLRWRARFGRGEAERPRRLDRWKWIGFEPGKVPRNC
uniref:Uncharacterized protein n=1 Tax=Oryza meridionalis TaxID=40149 RepID=A0A0E0BZ57_9ORYZ